jgi:hypothetical protein
MSDLNMLPYHLPDTYIDVVKAYRTQHGSHEQQSPLAKALSGWLFPSSMFEPDHQADCDQGSVETERTLEEDWEDDGLFGLSILLDEYKDGEEDHLYFNPTPEDFPRGRGSIQAQNELIEDIIEPEEQIDDEKSSQTHDASVAFAEGLMQSIDSVRSFADKAIKNACKKGEEVLQESEVFVNKTRDNFLQFFTPLSRDAIQKTTIPTSQRHLNKSSYSRKSASRKSAIRASSRDKTKSKGRRSKDANSHGDRKKKHTKPSHRRTMSRRLHPSALDQNDFPWY